jgi:hypothetical protein
LSLAQAAATLAAVTIGVEIGLFDQDLLNATLVVVLVTVLVSSIVTRAAARGIEPPAVQGERLAERVFVPVDVAEDPAVVRLAARLAMAKGGSVLVGAVAAAPGSQLDAARERTRTAESQASAVGAEAESVVRVDTSAVAGLAGLAVEHDATLVVVGWRKAAVAVDVVLGGQNLDFAALADTPVLTLLSARDEYRRVILALDERDLDQRRAAERDLAAAVAGIAAAGARGRGVILAPRHLEAPDAASFVGGEVEILVDTRPRRDAVAALAREDDLVIVPSRPGAPLHRDALAIASLPTGCSVGVPARPHAAAALVTGAPVLVGSRTA